MATRIERFEELVAWQNARALTRLICEATRRDEFTMDFGCRVKFNGQQVRSRQISPRDPNDEVEGSFTSFFRLQRVRWAEARSQLYVALDVAYIGTRTVEDLKAQV